MRRECGRGEGGRVMQTGAGGFARISVSGEEGSWVGVELYATCLNDYYRKSGTSS